MTADHTDDRSGAFLELASNQHYTLVLVVSGTTPNSRRAIANVRAICETQLVGRHTLTIIDLYQQPEFAEREQIVAVPTLIRRQPPPVWRMVGDLSDPKGLLLPSDRSRRPN